MQILFNSRSAEYKSPFGAISVKETANFIIKTYDGVYVNKISIIFNFNNSAFSKIDFNYVGKESMLSIFECSVSFNKPGVYFYYFLVDSEKGKEYFYKDKQGNITRESDCFFQLSVFDIKDHLENNYNNLIYHIFVDRFSRGKDGDSIWDNSQRKLATNSVLKNWGDKLTIKDEDGVYRANDFYGGNLQGIIDKLDYLKQLGVSSIYLSPIFESWSNHRYDTADYFKIDQLLGDEEKYVELVKKANYAGISIILDGVFNHTGSDSVYFNKANRYKEDGAFQSKSSKFYDWFTFTQYPDTYDCWWGITVTPTVRGNCDEFKKLIASNCGVLEKWLSAGDVSLRLDVVDELNIDFVKKIYSKAKSINKNALVIGEVWEDASNKISYSAERNYFDGNKLDGVMNYVFKDCIMSYVLYNNVEDFVCNVNDIIENYPKHCLDNSMTLLGTHDTVRILNRLSEIKVDNTTKEERNELQLNDQQFILAKNRLVFASAIQYVLPGIPTVYYGDERGMQGFEDPMNRACIDWDNCDEKLLKHYKNLGNIRKNNLKIFNAECRVWVENGILVIERHLNNKTKILAYFNNSYKTVSIQNAGYDIYNNKNVKNIELKNLEFLYLLVK